MQGEVEMIVRDFERKWDVIEPVRRVEFNDGVMTVNNGYADYDYKLAQLSEILIKIQD